ncbi:MAG TPA: hypothetical protein VNZ52_11680 [Candidatus Thermoplasmatota archaeon]|nr:hypothetical protein [Candidatus Thermoplasmatota archaeon]
MFSKTALVLGIAMLFAVPALADQSADYAVSTTPFVSVTGTVAGMNIGGAEIAANGETPVGITVADTSGTEVSFTVCQDNDDDGLCGEAGEATQTYCGTTVTLPDTFLAEYSVLVFVEAVNPACPGALATSGTITVHYSTE